MIMILVIVLLVLLLSVVLPGVILPGFYLSGVGMPVLFAITIVLSNWLLVILKVNVLPDIVLLAICGQATRNIGVGHR